MSTDAADAFVGIFGFKRMDGVFMRHPVGEPIPEGWELANDMQSNHHGVHCVLIRKL